MQSPVNPQQDAVDAMSPEWRADYLAFTLQAIAADFEALRALVAAAQEVKDIFPLWADTRELETEFANIRNEAARKVDTLQIRDFQRSGLATWTPMKARH